MFYQWGSIFGISPKEIVKNVFAKTISNNLVRVQPMSSMNTEELDRIKKEVKQENRDRKIESLIDNKEFNEMKVEDHPDYNHTPKGKLYYLDFKYQ